MASAPDGSGFLAALLACPDCRTPLVQQEDELVCGRCQEHYPVVRDVPRFVEAKNYASNFGLQWNRFRRTQLDSYSGVSISRSRFFRQTGWDADALRGRLVLDVGCGAGRFTEVALSCGARVVAIDFSSAVDACRANFPDRENLLVVQADIRRLPFALGTFDFVYCFGVLQHTPEPAAAFAALPPMVKDGGCLAIDVYPRLPMNLLWPKYWLRPLTRQLPPHSLFSAVERCVPVLLPLSRALGRTPVVGRWLRHVIPVVNYEGIYPLDERQLAEWAILDTYDMLAPAHDHPQSAATVERWMRSAGIRDVEVFRSGFLVGRGTRAAT